MIKENLRYEYKGLKSQVFIPIIIALTILRIFYDIDNEFIFVTGVLCLSISILLFIMSMIKVNNKELESLKLIGRGYFFIAVLGFIFIFIVDINSLYNVNLISTFFQMLIFLDFINIIISTVIYNKNYAEIIQFIFFLVILILLFCVIISDYRNLEHVHYFFKSKIGSIITLIFGSKMFLSIVAIYKKNNLGKNEIFILEMSFFIFLSNDILFFNNYFHKDFLYFIWTSKLIYSFLLYNEFEKRLLYDLYSNDYESLNKSKEMKKNLNKSLKDREKELKDLNLLLKKSEKNIKM